MDIHISHLTKPPLQKYGSTDSLLRSVRSGPQTPTTTRSKSSAPKTEPEIPDVNLSSNTPKTPISIADLNSKRTVSAFDAISAIAATNGLLELN